VLAALVDQVKLITTEMRKDYSTNVEIKKK
jgi:hypothetical protein